MDHLSKSVAAPTRDTHRLVRRIMVSPELIAQFCKRWHIREMALFGSVFRDDFDCRSDLDVLVEFRPAGVPQWHFFSQKTHLTFSSPREVVV